MLFAVVFSVQKYQWLVVAEVIRTETAGNAVFGTAAFSNQA